MRAEIGEPPGGQLAAAKRAMLHGWCGRWLRGRDRRRRWRWQDFLFFDDILEQNLDIFRVILFWKLRDHRIGLVHQVLAPDQLLPRAVEIAGLIAANAPLAVEGTKAVAQEWRQLQVDESYRYGNWVGRVVLTSEDAKEGPRAFVEKRPPVWKGR